MQRTIYGADHRLFRDTVRGFLETEVIPYYADWEAAGRIPPEVYAKAGEFGLVGIQVPEEYGGGGERSYKFNAVLTEETCLANTGLGSLRVHMDVVLPYILHYANDEQKARWLPGVAAGTCMLAIAMTEPDAGSDLAAIATTAVRDGDDYVINGAKTFITGGANAGLVLTVCRTSDPDPGDRRTGLSLIAVDTSLPGFSTGTAMHKIGLKAQDTVELFYSDVRVPVTDLLGEEGKAFSYLSFNLAQERLAIAINSVAQTRQAIRLARDYTNERLVFGKELSSFQNTKFVLAECYTEYQAAQALLDKALEAHDQGELTPAEAASVKLFTTEVAGRVVDKCLQLHGGYGYITEYPIARLYADVRVTRIYGGTSEVLKTIISKNIDV